MLIVNCQIITYFVKLFKDNSKLNDAGRLYYAQKACKNCAYGLEQLGLLRRSRK